MPVKRPEIGSQEINSPNSRTRHRAQVVFDHNATQLSAHPAHITRGRKWLLDDFADVLKVINKCVRRFTRGND